MSSGGNNNNNNSNSKKKSPASSFALSSQVPVRHLNFDVNFGYGSRVSREEGGPMLVIQVMPHIRKTDPI